MNVHTFKCVLHDYPPGCSGSFCTVSRDVDYVIFNVIQGNNLHDRGCKGCQSQASKVQVWVNSVVNVHVSLHRGIRYSLIHICLSLSALRRWQSLLLGTLVGIAGHIDSAAIQAMQVDENGGQFDSRALDHD